MATDPRPPVLTAGRIPELAARLCEGGGLLLGLDFDGTLAPIADDPDAPVITPGARRALATLAVDPAVIVTVISGRSLVDLRPRVGIDGVIYWGNHGLERWLDGRPAVHPHAARHRTAISRAAARLADRLANVPGVTIEDKGLTATVHVRHVPSEQVDEISAAVEATVSSIGPRLTLEDGKHLMEIRPTVEWDKGAVMAHLSAVLGDGWSAMYIGDDATDEDAFRAVRPDGLGVLVGSRPDTDARYRLPTQAAVAPFLDRLGEERLGRQRR